LDFETLLGIYQSRLGKVKSGSSPLSVKSVESQARLQYHLNPVRIRYTPGIGVCVLKSDGVGEEELPERIVHLIDYGMGNLHSVSKAFEKAGASVLISDNPNEISRAEALVLPGVGAFRAAMCELQERSLIEPIMAHVRLGKPFIGICLGYQLLFESSEEDGPVKGLGIFKGEVVRFQNHALEGDETNPTDEGQISHLTSVPLKIPHMGWNQVRQVQRSELFECIPDDAFFYFVHSYYPVPRDPNVVIGETEYGVSFASVVGKDRIYGVQFHPEKSQTIGARMLSNFVRIAFA